MVNIGDGQVTIPKLKELAINKNFDELSDALQELLGENPFSQFMAYITGSNGVSNGKHNSNGLSEYTPSMTGMKTLVAYVLISNSITIKVSMNNFRFVRCCEYSSRNSECCRGCYDDTHKCNQSP